MTPFFLKKIKPTKSVFICGLILVLAWVSFAETTGRRSREAADRFLGPALEVFEWKKSRLLPWAREYNFRDAKWVIYGPSWVLLYEDRFIINDFPVELNVDLCGNVRASNTKMFDDWIRLSEKERVKQQLAAVESERMQHTQFQSKH